MANQWDETLHPRDEGGKFAPIGDKGIIPDGRDDISAYVNHGDHGLVYTPEHRDEYDRIPAGSQWMDIDSGKISGKSAPRVPQGPSEEALRSLDGMKPRAHGYAQWLESEQLEDDDDSLEEYLESEHGISVRDDGLVQFDRLNSEVEQIIGDLPVVLYHHTSDALEAGIREHGLRRGGKENVPVTNPHKNTSAGVYLTTEASGPVVEGYQGVATQAHGGSPRVFEVETSLSDLIPDPDDEELGMSDRQFITAFVPADKVLNAKRRGVRVQGVKEGDPLRYDEEFEKKHPRGGKENPGQFASSTGAASATSIDELQSQLRAEHADNVDLLHLDEGDNYVQLSHVRMKDGRRGHGSGSKIIRSLQEYAASKGKPIVLMASPEPRKKAALNKFYASHGFRPPGRSKDFSLPRHTHVWHPKNGLTERYGDDDIPIRYDAEFERKHPRGNPDNAGQFTSSPSAGSGDDEGFSLTRAPAKTPKKATFDTTSKAKQGALFSTSGLAGQMDLFKQAGTPDDLVQKDKSGNLIDTYETKEEPEAEEPPAEEPDYNVPENEDRREFFEGKTVYDEDYDGARWSYGFQYRPPGYAHNPKGFVIGSDKGHADFNHGTIDYPFPLTGKEIYDFELTPVYREGQKVQIPQSEISRPGEVQVKAIKDGYAYVGMADYDYKENLYGTAKMPVESLTQFFGDMSGQAFIRPSKHPEIEAVRLGKAEILGKGDDGVAFGVGDKVVKMSTTVPYVWNNPGHRTPDQAVDMIGEDYATGRLLRKAGVPCIPEQKVYTERGIGKSGDKAFLVMERLDTTTPLNAEQLAQVKDSVKAMHKAGWTINDSIQVGIGKDGNAYHFDLGKASVGKDKYAVEDDIYSLKRLYNDNGHELMPWGEKAESAYDHWKWIAPIAAERKDTKRIEERANIANKARQGIIDDDPGRAAELNAEFAADLTKYGLNPADYMEPHEISMEPPKFVQKRLFGKMRFSKILYKEDGASQKGWHNLGGARVFTGDDGTILKGCPGLKGHDIADLDETSDERAEDQEEAEDAGWESEETKRARDTHAAAKEHAGNDFVVLTRIGDKVYSFGGDAALLQDLTQTGDGESASFDAENIDHHMMRLVQAGHRVAVVDRQEDGDPDLDSELDDEAEDVFEEATDESTMEVLANILKEDQPDSAADIDKLAESATEPFELYDAMNKSATPPSREARHQMIKVLAEHESKQSAVAEENQTDSEPGDTTERTEPADESVVETQRETEVAPQGQSISDKHRLTGQHIEQAPKTVKSILQSLHGLRSTKRSGKAETKQLSPEYARELYDHIKNNPEAAEYGTVHDLSDMLGHGAMGYQSPGGNMVMIPPKFKTDDWDVRYSLPNDDVSEPEPAEESAPETVMPPRKKVPKINPNTELGRRINEVLPDASPEEQSGFREIIEQVYNRKEEERVDRSRKFNEIIGQYVSTEPAGYTDKGRPLPSPASKFKNAIKAAAATGMDFDGFARKNKEFGNVFDQMAQTAATYYPELLSYEQGEMAGAESPEEGLWNALVSQYHTTTAARHSDDVLEEALSIWDAESGDSEYERRRQTEHERRMEEDPEYREWQEELSSAEFGKGRGAIKYSGRNLSWWRKYSRQLSLFDTEHHVGDTKTEGDTTYVLTEKTHGKPRWVAQRDVPAPTPPPPPKQQPAVTPAKQSNEELVARFQAGDRDALADIVSQNQGLVRKRARQWSSRSDDFDDLVQEGNIALMRAAEKYDPSKGVAFAKYAYFWIKAAIERSSNRSSNQNLGEQLGEDSRMEETAYDEGTKPVKDDVPDKEYMRILVDTVHELPERQALIMAMRFGLDGHDPHELKEIGDKLGVSKQAIHKAVNSAMAKLRANMKMSRASEKAYHYARTFKTPLEKLRRAVQRYVKQNYPDRYARTPGETMTKNGVTYVLNDNHRWMRQQSRKQPHEMTKEEYASHVAKLQPKAREHLKLGGMTVIQNPDSSDYMMLKKVAREQFPGLRAGEATTRFTQDKEGNRWIWQAHEGTHQMVEPLIQEHTGSEVNQNFDVPSHRDHVREAMRSRLEIPPEVQKQYPQWKEFFDGTIDYSKESIDYARQPGETMVKNGVTYVLNENHRWTRPKQPQQAPQPSSDRPPAAPGRRTVNSPPETPQESAPDAAHEPVDPTEAAISDWKRRGVESEAFKGWFGDWQNDPLNASKIVDIETGEPSETAPYSTVTDREGMPLIVYHGTTHEFEEFTNSRANPENDLGTGFYFTEDVGDADANYAGEGPDLTNRLQSRSEQLENEWEYDQDKVREEFGLGDDVDTPDYLELARKELVGGTPRTIRAYLNIRKPVVLAERGGTFIDSEPEVDEHFHNEMKERLADAFRETAFEDTEDVEGLIADSQKLSFDEMYSELVGHVDDESQFDEVRDEWENERYDYEGESSLVTAIRETSVDFEGVDPDQLIEELEIYEGVSAYKLYKTMKSSEASIYAEYGDQGMHAVGEWTSRIFQQLGFDGVIYEDASEHFPNMNIPPDTRHFIAFNPTQVKASDNRGTFDPNDPRMKYSALRSAVLRYVKENYPEQYARQPKSSPGQMGLFDQPHSVGDTKTEGDTTYVLTEKTVGKPRWIAQRPEAVGTSDATESKCLESDEWPDDQEFFPESDAQPRRPDDISQWTDEQKIEDWRNNHVRSKPFKAWFGDWEHDADNASKVVDPDTGAPQEQGAMSAVRNEDGTPVKVYHGTAKGGFDKFDKQYLAPPNELLFGQGFYFTEDINLATEYKDKGATPEFTSTPELLAKDIREHAEWVQNDEGESEKPSVRADRVDRFLTAASKLESDPDASWLDDQNNPEREFLKTWLPMNVIERHWTADKSKAEIKHVYLNIRNPYDAEDGMPILDRLPEDMQAKIRERKRSEIESKRGHQVKAGETAAYNRNEAQMYAAKLFESSGVRVPKWDELKSRGLQLTDAEDQAFRSMTTGQRRLMDEWVDSNKKADANQELSNKFAKERQQIESGFVRYDDLLMVLGGKGAVNDWLAQQGYDGITHIGGQIMGNKKHRVWIAFEPNQIKAADNVGTFNPDDDRMRYQYSKLREGVLCYVKDNYPEFYARRLKSSPGQISLFDQPHNVGDTKTEGGHTYVLTEKTPGKPRWTSAEVAQDQGYFFAHDRKPQLDPRSTNAASTYNEIGTWLTSSADDSRLYGPEGHQVSIPQGNLLEAHTDDFDAFFGSNANLAREVGLTSEADQVAKMTPNSSEYRKLRKRLDEGTLTRGEEKKYTELSKSRNAAQRLMNSPEYMQAFRSMLQSAGYQGIVWKDTKLDGAKEPRDIYVVFNESPLETREMQQDKSGGSLGGFPTAGEAIKAGAKSIEDWQGPISNAYVNEDIDEDHPAWQEISSQRTGIKAFNAARDVFGKRIFPSFSQYHRKPGIVTDVSDDASQVTVTHPDGSTSVHAPDSLSSFGLWAADHIKRGVDLPEDYLDYFGEVIADKIDDGRTMWDVLRNDYRLAGEGMKLSRVKPVVDAVHRVRERRIAEKNKPSEARQRAMDRQRELQGSQNYSRLRSVVQRYVVDNYPDYYARKFKSMPGQGTFDFKEHQIGDTKTENGNTYVLTEKTPNKPRWVAQREEQDRLPEPEAPPDKPDYSQPLQVDTGSGTFAVQIKFNSQDDSHAEMRFPEDPALGELSGQFFARVSSSVLEKFGSNPDTDEERWNQILAYDKIEDAYKRQASVEQASRSLATLTKAKINLNRYTPAAHSIDTWCSFQILADIKQVDADVRRFERYAKMVDDYNDTYDDLNYEETAAKRQKLDNAVNSRPMQQALKRYPVRERGAPDRSTAAVLDAAEQAGIARERLVSRLATGQYDKSYGTSERNYRKEHEEGVSKASHAGEFVDLENKAYYAYKGDVLSEADKQGAITHEWIAAAKKHKSNPENLKEADAVAEKLSSIDQELDAMIGRLGTVPKVQEYRELKESRKALNGIISTRQEQLNDVATRKQDAAPGEYQDLSEEWDALWKQQREAGSELVRIDAQLINTKKEILGHVWAALRPARGAHISLKPTNDNPPVLNKPEAVGTAEQWLSAMMDSSHGAIELFMHSSESSHNADMTQRAHARGSNMWLAPHDGSATIIHEAGHNIEAQDDDRLGKLSRAYWLHRTKDWHDESHLGGSYGATEVASRDKFWSAYTGKYYVGNHVSEILAMGLQHMYEDPLGFLEADLGHFKYTLAVMHGKL